jgi:hypothetical protein
MSFVLRYANKPSFSMEHSIKSINPSADTKEKQTVSTPEKPGSTASEEQIETSPAADSVEEEKVCHKEKLSSSEKKRQFKRTTTDETIFQFPKLLVSIGSGVSIIKVDDFNSF